MVTLTLSDPFLIVSSDERPLTLSFSVTETFTVFPLTETVAQGASAAAVMLPPSDATTTVPVAAGASKITLWLTTDMVLPKEYGLISSSLQEETMKTVRRAENIIGILVGAAIAGVLLLVIEIVFKFLGPNQYTAAVMSIVFLTVFICFPKVIWPKVSSGMSCFYGVGSYKIEVGHLGITMGKRSYSFFDIDEVYLTGPQEGGGSMQGGVTTFDGSLEIKEGKRKLQIVTWNSYVVNTDTYSVISLFDDIKEYFPSLKPVLMDNGTEIRGYLRKEIDNGC